LAIAFVIAGLPSKAPAQTQIRPRVILMVDTSGSMTLDFSGTDTFGDGSTNYSDNTMTNSLASNKNMTLYVGRETAGVCTSPPATLSSYAGIGSRMFAAKGALTDVINGSGDIDWGLMRYTGTQCALVSNTFVPDGTLPNGIFNNKTCNRNNQC